jgi:acyl-CoA synthetase (AMP-forming)/AMP-acid ligase II/thioesterase domain-containing protein/acyl carrier protein
MTCAPLNPAYSEREFEYYLDALRPDAVIVPAGLDVPARTVAHARGIRIIESSPHRENEAGLFVLTTPPQAHSALNGFARPNDVALLLHTSGTTSRPKIVPLTHINVCTEAYDLHVAHELCEADRCLNIMPLFHASGLIGSVLPSLVAGASIVCTPISDATKFFEWMDEFHPTWYAGTPAMHQALLVEASRNRRLIHRSPLRFIRSSTAPLPGPVLTALEELFSAPVIEAYGLTESSAHIASNPLPPRERKAGSVGLALGSSQVAVMDEAGGLLPPNKTGEIVLRGATVMHGYENNPTTNASTFANGWFRTGDQGFLDDAGYLFITGRLKEIINRGGQKIAPREIEEALLGHPAVAEVAAFAIPHPRLGEDIAAAVVLRDNAPVRHNEIRDFARARLVSFKVPSRFVFVGAIPRGATGKVQRLDLAERLGLLGSENAGGAVNASPVGSPTVSPGGSRIALEGKLAEIWAEVLGLPNVGRHDDFFEIGGDSLQALNLLARIEQVFGNALPPSTLLEAPTVEQLAAVIADHGQTPWASLVAIRQGGCKLPFFCVHAHDGDVLALKRLASYLNPDQPLYGIQPQGLEERARDSRIEEIAAQCVREVVALRGDEPYLLGGYCFGGAVAYEMAHQLRLQGRNVILLALIDAYAPGFPEVLPLLPRVKQKVIYHWQTMGHQPMKAKLSYAAEKWTTLKDRFDSRFRVAMATWSGEQAETVNLDVPEHADLRAMRDRYVAKPSPGKLTIFRPRTEPIHYRRDPAMGWGSLALGDVDIYEVPCRQGLMFSKPQIQALAEQLTVCLDRAAA